MYFLAQDTIMVRAQICLYLFVLVVLTVGTLGQRESYQFLLDIVDKLDPEWVSTTHEDVRSKLQCASLCFRGNQTNCGSFGYKNNTCYLLKSSIDKESCSQDDCSDSGMKIYKWKEPKGEKGWSCDPPDAKEVEINCKDNNYLLRSIGSRSPFFGDVLGATCTDMKEQIFGDAEEKHTFFAEDDGISIKAFCPKKNQIIVKFVLCVKKTRIPAMTLHCRELNEPDKVEEQFKVTNEEQPNFIDCKNAAAITKITFGPWPDNDAQTFVEFGCAKVEFEDDKAPPDTP